MNKKHKWKNATLSISSIAVALFLSLATAGSGYSADKTLSTTPAKEQTAQLYETLHEKITPEGIEVIPGLMYIGTLMEVEAEYREQDGQESSDLKLSTFELGLEVKAHELLKGYALLLWEQDDTEPIDLDEAYLVLGDGKGMPLSLTAGRFYLPFGMFYSHFITDPITLELGETRKTAAMLGYTHDYFDIHAGAFRRDIADEDSRRLNRFFGALNLRPAEFIECGGYFISDLGESDTLSDTINSGDPGKHQTTPGAGGYIHITAGLFEVEAEYIAAVENFEQSVLADEKLRPETWNIELACNVLSELKLAGRYEESCDFPEYPERQYGAAASYGLMAHTTLSLEYLRGEFNDSRNNHHLVTTQLAVGF